MQRIVFSFLFILVSMSLSAQVPSLYSMHAKWGDEITQWTIQTVDEEINGELLMRWEALNRIDEWDFSFEGVRGFIKMKKLSNKEQWELRIGNEIVTILQMWVGDFREWRITDNTNTVEFKNTKPFDPFFWKLKEEARYGKFEMYSEYEGDPRDWIILDEMDASFSFAMKMAMTFVPIIPLLPRN